MSSPPLPSPTSRDTVDGVEIDPGIWMPHFVAPSDRTALAVSMRTPDLIGFNPPTSMSDGVEQDSLSVESDYADALSPTDEHPVYAGLADPLLGDAETRLDGQKPDVAAHAVHEWGGTIVEELVYLALGASAQDDVHRVSLSVDQRLMVSVAKVMAARVLLANVACKAPLVAITSGYRQTAFAAHNNRTRATIAATAAFLGGADLIAVRPHTWATGRVSNRDVRDALNVGRVLRDEATLGSLKTPARGSGWAEAAALKLAQAAWARCREIGSDGVTDYARGLHQVAQEQHAARTQSLSPIVGVTRHERQSDRLAQPPLAQSVANGYRLTGEHESLRHAAQLVAAHAV